MTDQDARARAIAEQVASGCLIWDKRDFDFDKAASIIASALSATADTARAQGRQDADIAKRKAVANCYMMAKREIARIRNGNSVDAISLERWQHVLRFCEESGEKSSILRDGLPTEITDGGTRAAQETRHER